MKKLFKGTVLFIACLALILSLASCGKGVNASEAKVFIGEFLDAVEAEDYQKAETYLHPDVTQDLEEYLSTVESNKNIDFQAGIEIEKYTGFSSSLYHSKVNGARYETTFKASVGDATVTFTVEVVQNDNGYGIYNINIDT